MWRSAVPYHVNRALRRPAKPTHLTLYGIPDDEVVVVSLVGGLGNQMFQYAAGRRLASVTGARLVLDVRWFRTQTKQRYGLGEFGVDADVVDTSEASHGRRRTLRVVREDGFHFHPELLAEPADCCLVGYWQSERYFADVADRIRADFDLATSPPKGAGSDATVSVHVRRGDYVAEPETSAYHGTCSLGYYQRAMRLVRQLVPGATFQLFSDDPQWAQEHLAGDDASVVSDIDGLPHRDLALMAQCRHHVLANSSFSWWGAWLGDPGGVTIAPRPWFLTPDNNTKDLLPREWITLGA